MTLIELAQKLRPYIEKAAISLSDEDALEAINLFPNWHDDVEQYIKDQRVNYDGILYKCLQTHIPQANWNPKDAPSLWAKVLIPDENTIPEWEQPDSTNPYMKDDKVKHLNKTWISIIDYNVYEPGIYGWNEIS